MTWKEFKDAVESQGVGDASEISYIDITTDLAGEVMTTQDRPPVGPWRIES